MNQYTINRAATPPVLSGKWDAQPWPTAQTLSIDHYYPQGVTHRPTTRARVLYDDRGLYLMFHVEDRFVRCVHTTHQQQVCQDSCVEFFVQPKPDAGYFNIETNCGGTILLYYIEDPTRAPGGFKKFELVSDDWIRKIQVYHSMPHHIPEEIAEPVQWINAFFVPYTLFEAYVGSLDPVPGQTWRGNFFKCGDHTSHPHWVSWTDLDNDLNFHRPETFGQLIFAS